MVYPGKNGKGRIMIFFSKQDFMEFWDMCGRALFLGGVSALFGVGFLIGAMQPENKQMCTYDSLASRLNLGYVLGCELWRPRWAKPCDLKKVIGANHPENYSKSYHIVTFEDGLVKTMEFDPAMIGKSIRVCE